MGEALHEAEILDLVLSQQFLTDNLKISWLFEESLTIPFVNFSSYRGPCKVLGTAAFP